MADRKMLTYINDDLDFYEHQVGGVRWCARKQSFILADDMGLGKSLQALTTFAVDVERSIIECRNAGAPAPILRLLVVCPATLKGNWLEEIATNTTFRAVVLEGTPDARSKRLALWLDDPTVQVVIVNYEQVKSHLPELNAAKFHAVIYDEAHYIKGPKSARTKATLRISAPRHFVLTGSPMLNHVGDLWALLHRVNPSEFPSYWRFIQRYATFGGYNGKQITGIQNEDELIDKLNEVMLRRLKKDCLDLPDKQVIPIYVDLTKEQRDLYDYIKEEMEVPIPGLSEADEIENAVVRFLRLKQVCSTTANLEGYADSSAKLDEAENMLDQILKGGQKKVVVFTQFRGTNFAAAARFRGMGVKTYELQGDVKQEDRVPMVRQWANDDRHAVIIAGLQVAGVGLNMTAARTAIRLDKLFVPKLNEQAEDRLHRIGADKSQPVQIFDIIARNTVEARIEAINRKKSKLFDTVVDQSEFKKMLVKFLKEEDDEEAP